MGELHIFDKLQASIQHSINMWNWIPDGFNDGPESWQWVLGEFDPAPEPLFENLGSLFENPGSSGPQSLPASRTEPTPSPLSSPPAPTQWPFAHWPSSEVSGAEAFALLPECGASYNDETQIKRRVARQARARYYMERMQAALFEQQRLARLSRPYSVDPDEPETVELISSEEGSIEVPDHRCAVLRLKKDPLRDWTSWELEKCDYEETLESPEGLWRKLVPYCESFGEFMTLLTELGENGLMSGARYLATYFCCRVVSKWFLDFDPLKESLLRLLSVASLANLQCLIRGLFEIEYLHAPSEGEDKDYTQRNRWIEYLNELGRPLLLTGLPLGGAAIHPSGVTGALGEALTHGRAVKPLLYQHKGKPDSSRVPLQKVEAEIRDAWEGFPEDVLVFDQRCVPQSELLLRLAPGVRARQMFMTTTGPVCSMKPTRNSRGVLIKYGECLTMVENLTPPPKKLASAELWTLRFQSAPTTPLMEALRTVTSRDTVGSIEKWILLVMDNPTEAMLHYKRFLNSCPHARRIYLNTPALFLKPTFDLLATLKQNGVCDPQDEYKTTCWTRLSQADIHPAFCSPWFSPIMAAWLLEDLVSGREQYFLPVDAGQSVLPQSTCIFWTSTGQVLSDQARDGPGMSLTLIPGKGRNSHGPNAGKNMTSLLSLLAIITRSGYHPGEGHLTIARKDTTHRGRVLLRSMAEKYRELLSASKSPADPLSVYKAEIAADFDWDAARDDAENVPSMLLYTHYVIQDSLQKMRHFKTKDKHIAAWQRRYVAEKALVPCCTGVVKREKGTAVPAADCPINVGLLKILCCLSALVEVLRTLQWQGINWQEEFCLYGSKTTALYEHLTTLYFVRGEVAESIETEPDSAELDQPSQLLSPAEAQAANLPLPPLTGTVQLTPRFPTTYIIPSETMRSLLGWCPAPTNFRADLWRPASLAVPTNTIVQPATIKRGMPASDRTTQGQQKPKKRDSRGRFVSN